MTKLLLVASLLLPALAPALARADTPVPKLLIEETHAGLGIDVGTAGFQIFDDGSYRVYSHDPKAMRSIDRKGMLTAKELTEVKAALLKAPWKVTHSAVTCDALATAHTLWAAGKHSFDARLCSPDTIDATTRRLFATVDALETKHLAE